MTILSIIEHKRDGKKLSRDEIDYLIGRIAQNAVPDYQSAAWLMAVYLQGMDETEAYYLTEAMAKYSDHLPEPHRITADKHSSGGVGDKTTLILGPIAASYGVAMPKMSGRGLGHTGGTIDKLESIPGFQTKLSMEHFYQIVDQCGLAVSGQTANLAPADKKLYALRDVTGTVGAVPLIASSIMSKKLVSGNQIIVLDVKYGSGAFMKTPEEAAQLGELMVSIGKQAGRKTAAIVSDMNHPLGYAVGNANEVLEAAAVLRGELPESDIETLSFYLAGEILFLAGKASDEREGILLAKEAVKNGSAYQKFLQWISLQGGDISIFSNPALITDTKHSKTVYAPQAGYITAMNSEQIGRCAMELGAGRKTMEDQIDPAAGITLFAKTGEYVKKDQPLAEFRYNEIEAADEILGMFLKAFQIEAQKPEDKPLIFTIIRS